MFFLIHNSQMIECIRCCMYIFNPFLSKIMEMVLFANERTSGSNNNNFSTYISPLNSHRIKIPHLSDSFVHISRFLTVSRSTRVFQFIYYVYSIFTYSSKEFTSILLYSTRCLFFPNLELFAYRCKNFNDLFIY